MGDWEIFTNLFFFTYSLSRYVDKLSWPHVKPVLLFFQRAECEEVGPVALVLSHLIYFFDVSLAGLFTLIPEEVGVCADSTSRPLTFLTVDVTSLPLNVVGRFVNNVASVWLCDFDLTLTRLFADPFTLLSRDLAAFSSPRADYFLTRAINFLEPQLWALYGTFYSE